MFQVIGDDIFNEYFMLFIEIFYLPKCPIMLGHFQIDFLTIFRLFISRSSSVPNFGSGYGISHRLEERAIIHQKVEYLFLPSILLIGSCFTSPGCFEKGRTTGQKYKEKRPPCHLNCYYERHVVVWQQALLAQRRHHPY